MIGALPEYLTIGDMGYEVRADYRNVLQVFEAFSDPELEQAEKWIVAIYLLLKPFSCADDVLETAADGFNLDEAAMQIIWFISGGKDPGNKKELPVYDWAQDEQMIFSAVNKIAGKETRELEYLHWWTFLGYLNEIGEGNFSFVVGIRSKLNKHKKLEKHEKEYLNGNREVVVLKKRESKEELEQKAECNELLDRLLM